MAENAKYRPGYQPPTLGVRGIVIFIICFALTLTVLFLVLRAWYQTSQVSPTRLAPALPPALPQPLQPSMGHPSLPRDDLALLRQEQELLLRTGGAIPGDSRHVRIPIDEAMDRLLKSGVLKQEWTPTSQPWIKPPQEYSPTVENRT
jgi:hypothetical protein